MKVTKGEWLDGNSVNKDNGSFEHARNLAIGDDFTSTRNAFGFNVEACFAGEGETLELVGKEVTNKGVAIFCNLYAGQRYAAIYLYDPETKVPKLVLKTSKFNWSLDNPIRSSHTFNYKGDLVLIWCDGTTPTSNRPMILNVETPDVILNANKEIVGNEECLYLFNTSTNIDFSAAVSKGGSLKGGAYFITVSYELNDESITNWSVLKGPIFIGKRSDVYTDSAIVLTFNDLNTNYRYLKVGVVCRSENIVIAKFYKKFSVSSNNLIIAISNNGGDDIDIREFTVRKAVYDKLNDITIVNNKEYVAAPVEYNNKLDYQKFANDIKVGYRYTTPNLTPNNPITMDIPTGGLSYKDGVIQGGINLTNMAAYPQGSDTNQYIGNSIRGFAHGETYAYYIFFVLRKSGHIVPAFHIPGRVAAELLNPNEVAHCKDPNLEGYHTNCYGKTIDKSFGCEQIPIAYFQNDLPILSPVVGKIQLDITIGLIKCTIMFNSLNDLNSFNLANSNTVNQNLWNDFSIYVENKFVIIKYTAINQEHVVTPININISLWLNINTVVTQVDGNKYFTKLFDKKWMLHGGGYSHTDFMSYWENTNELYPKDDETYFPTGKVRHHRFPLRVNSKVSELDLEGSSNLLKPYFDNIYIPQDLLEEVSHIGIAYAKRTNVDRTIWGQSPIFDVSAVDGGGSTNIEEALVSNRSYTYSVRDDGIGLFGLFSSHSKPVTNSYTINANYLATVPNFNVFFRGLYKTKFPDLVYSANSIKLTHLIPEYIEYVDYLVKYSAVMNSMTGSENTIRVGTFAKSRTDNGLKPYVKNVNYKKVVNVLVSKFVKYNSVEPLDGKENLIINNAGDSFIYVESDSHDKIIATDKTHWLSNYDGLMDNAYTDETCDNTPVSMAKYRFNPSKHIAGIPNGTTVGAKHVIVTGYVKRDNVYYDFTNQDLCIAAIKPISVAGYHSIGLNEDSIDGDTFKNVFTAIGNGLIVNPHNSNSNAYYQSLDNFAKNKCYGWGFINSTPFHCETTIDGSKLYIKEDQLNAVNTVSVIDNFKKDMFKDLKPLYDTDYNILQDIDVPIILSNFKINAYMFNAIAWSAIVNDVKSNLANLKSFKANDIYFMPIDNDEVVKLIGKNNNLYIQQKNALSLAMLKDRIEYKTGDVYLGTADIFDRAPIEIKDEEGGRISCEHFAHVCDHKFGITVVDTFKKAIYVVAGDKAGNISKLNMFNFFTNVFDTKINRALPVNPFTGNGLFTILDSTGMLHVYNKTSFNHCYSIHKQCWFGSYDWYADLAFTYRDNAYSFKFDTLHKHNDRTKKGKFHVSARHSPQSYYPTIVDVLFNAETDKDKRLDSIIINTTTQNLVANDSEKNLYNETIDSVMIYTDTQCSGIIPFELANIERSGYRMVQSKYVFNNFRDGVLNDKLPFITSDKQVITANVDVTKKDWYERSVFINNYFVIRIVINNDDDYDKIINDISLMINSVKR